MQCTEHNIYTEIVRIIYKKVINDIDTASSTII